MMRNRDLIDRVKDGRPGAFDELYYQYVDRVHRHLFSILGNDADLDDLVQQTFVQVHRRIHTFRGECSMSTWLHRVTVNVALGHLRKRRRWIRWREDEQLKPVVVPADPVRPDEAFGRREKLEVLHHVLSRLTPKKRVVFVLYEVEGHTLEEIGELLDTSINTIASRLRAARKEVRRALERRLKAAAEVAA